MTVAPSDSSLGKDVIFSKSVKRTTESIYNLVIRQLSASRTDDGLSAYPSSELLGYYHSSAIADWILKLQP